MNLEPPWMHAARRGPGVEHCQSAVLRNPSGPPPPAL